MKKIIERKITNDDGDFFGVMGDTTRLGAYRAIRKDLDGYGLLEDIDFTQDDLREVLFYKTSHCVHNGEHDDYIWWVKPSKEYGDSVTEFGWGWGVFPYEL